jgi:hypothetical protein
MMAELINSLILHGRNKEKRWANSFFFLFLILWWANSETVEAAAESKSCSHADLLDGSILFLTSATAKSMK